MRKIKGWTGLRTAVIALGLVAWSAVGADAAVFDAIQASLDELARMREQVANGLRVAPARAMITRIQALTRAAGAPPAVSAAAAPRHCCSIGFHFTFRTTCLPPALRRCCLPSL